MMDDNQESLYPIAILMYASAGHDADPARSPFCFKHDPCFERPPC